MKRLKRYIIQGALDQTDDLFERSQIELTYSLTLGFLFLYTLMLIHFNNLDTSFEFDLVNYLSWMGMPTVLVVLKFTKSHFWGGFTFWIIGLGISTAMVFLSKGEAMIQFGAWHSFSIVLCFLLLGRGWGYLNAMYYIGITILMLINKMKGWNMFDVGLYRGGLKDTDPIAVAIPMMAITYMLGHFLRTRNKAQNLLTIQKQREASQRLQLETKNREITDSIHYANQIQDAILPADPYMHQLLPKSFVLFLPKDIVSGDFYYVIQQGDYTIFATVDCTGHGVPGAMMSMLGYNGLNAAVKEHGNTDPGTILNKLDAFIQNALGTSDSRDGMDITICAYNPKQHLVKYAGANNGILQITNDEIQYHAAQKQPIGRHEGKQPFVTKEIPVMNGDMIYLFSDGYADQFGGPKGKKFKIKAFKSLLHSIYQMPVANQKEALKEALYTWMGKQDQVDDVCVMGVRI